MSEKRRIEFEFDNAIAFIHYEDGKTLLVGEFTTEQAAVLEEIFAGTWFDAKKRPTFATGLSVDFDSKSARRTYKAPSIEMNEEH